MRIKVEQTELWWLVKTFIETKIGYTHPDPSRLYDCGKYGCPLRYEESHGHFDDRGS